MKKHEIVVRPRAARDLERQAARIAQDDPAAADRLLDAARGAFSHLAALPGMGSARRFYDPRLRGLRLWPIPGFRNYLIYYRPRPRGIEVIRIVHAARDWKTLLGE